MRRTTPATQGDFAAIARSFRDWCRQEGLTEAVLLTTLGGSVDLEEMSFQHTLGLIKSAEVMAEEQMRILWQLAREDQQRQKQEAAQ